MADRITDEELEEIADVLGDGVREVMFPPQVQVDDLPQWVGLVLEAVGHPEAWVSDESMVGDFWIGDPDRQEQVDRVAEVLGIEVSSGDYIHEVARRLREANSV
jgi:hypothetical protein